MTSARGPHAHNSSTPLIIVTRPNGGLNHDRIPVQENRRPLRDGLVLWCLDRMEKRIAERLTRAEPQC
jgi:hypothetical protein